MTVQAKTHSSWHQRVRNWHKWLGIVVGLQMIIWMASGLYMVSIDIEKVHGDHFVNKTSSLPTADIAPVPEHFSHAKRVLLTSQLGRQIYLIDNRWLIDATNGKPIIVDKAYITQRARESYNGDAAILSVTKLMRYPDELGGRKRAIWRVDFDDHFDPSFYFSVQTAELVRKRSDLWRMFDFLWSLHIMDYQDGEDSHNSLLLIASIVAMLLTTSGIWLICYAMWLPAPVGKLGWIVNTHRYLVLIVGIQMLLWVASGLAFNLLSSDKTNSEIKVNRMTSARFVPQDINFNEIKAKFPSASRINIAATETKPLIYITGSFHDKQQLPPFTLALKNELLSREQIREIASRAINQSLPINKIELVKDDDTEARQFKRRVWRVHYDNDNHTAVYIDAYSGKVLKAIEDTWRLRDLFWMLHIMDYQTRSDFNNPLIISAAAIAFIGSLAGGVLVFLCIRVGRKNRDNSVSITFKSGDGEETVSALPQQTLLSALNNEQQRIPSGCGGKGTCGQCIVAIDNYDAPLNHQEQMTLRNSEINAGLRLACQTKLNGSLTVQLGAGDNFTSTTATVVNSRFVAPFIKEITLRTDSNFRYGAGQHVNVTIPVGSYRLSHNIPAEYKNQWQLLQASNPQVVVSATEQRSYSIANEYDGSGTVTLLVRLIEKNGQLGMGSGYLFSLDSGETIEISPALGEFTLERDQTREIVLVGAGSGLAPLRAMLQQAISQNRHRISLWVGARHQTEIVTAQYFDQLSSSHNNVQWRLSLSQPDSTWEGLNGYIQEHLFEGYLNKHQDLSQVDFYLCGPEAMMNDVRQRLLLKGVRHQQIKRDSFT
ncbi:MAG: 2Fe-2S iron-sulfur cluster-binding protein [Psychrobium sp.]